MKHPLHVAFVWHFHQPSYLDAARGELLMPWVRLHAAKDYLHMVDVLEDFPAVHATFNVVPSLVEQIQGYLDGSVLDRAWKVSLKERLTGEDKRYIDSLFFSVNRERLMSLYPRYQLLARLRDEAGGDLDLLGDAYWRDLIAWFNLAWIDPTSLKKDPVLRSLVAKGSHFAMEDVARILEKHREMMGSSLGAYRRLQRRGQVELSVTPFYHPIMPLLINSGCAAEASPWTRLPGVRFQHREDASEQLRRGLRLHEETFGRTPAGLWPSEGAVSQELIELLAELPEVRWLATDEAILARSLGKKLERNGWGYLADPRFLYQPYWARTGDRRVSMVFRDHYLSDRVGFVYKDMGARQGAEDLVFRLACIYEAVKHEPRPSLVPIILDGENCWEHYECNGETFLRFLYERLSTEQWVRTVTVSEFLDQFPPVEEIPRLATGSWINGNLETWIGEDAQNRAWEYLHAARETLEEAAAGGRVAPDRLRRAKDAMMRAEGSDWLWWYYSHNVSDHDDAYDYLFRSHLSAVYEALGSEVPAWLDRPVFAAAPKLSSRAPVGHIRPTLSAEDLSPVPWEDGGFIDAGISSGSMQQGSGLLKKLYFGSDEERLYLRLQANSSLNGHTVSVYLSAGDLPENPDGHGELRLVAKARPAEFRSATPNPYVEIVIRPGAGSAEVRRSLGDSAWESLDPPARLVDAGTLLEFAVSLEGLGVSPSSRLGLFVAVFKDNLVVHRLPAEGEVVLDLANVAGAVS